MASSTPRSSKSAASSEPVPQVIEATPPISLADVQALRSRMRPLLDAQGTENVQAPLDGLRQKVWSDRYAARDDQGKIVETSLSEMAERVAAGIAMAEPDDARRLSAALEFYPELASLRFVPAGRILSTAGLGLLTTYFNCYVLPLDGSSRAGFIAFLKAMIDTMARGGGVGGNFSQVPPQGMPWSPDEVLPAPGVLRNSAPPVALLGVSHPDAASLVEMATNGPTLYGMSANKPAYPHLTVCLVVDSAFRQAVTTGTPYVQRFSNEKHQEERTIDAAELWQKITVAAGKGLVTPIFADDETQLTAALDVMGCTRVPSPEDSRGGIVDTLHAMWIARARGYRPAISFDTLRPMGAYIKSVNGRSSGMAAWLHLYNAVAAITTTDPALSPGPVALMEICSTATGKVIDQGGCFGPNQRIATNRGLLRASELATLIEAGETVDALTHEGPRRITWSFRNGIKPLLRVTTSRGFSVEVTREHKMGVLRDGSLVTIPLAELEVGDEVVLFLGDAVEADYVTLSTPVYERSIMSTRLNEAVRLPTVIDERLAYFLGYLYGDGYVHWGKKVTWEAPKAIKLATADAYPAIRERLVSLARELFALEPIIESRVDDACTNVALYSRVLVEWLQHNGLLKAHSEAVRVPEAIFHSPSSVMAAFVTGYFDADGSDRGRKAGYGFDSVSLEMLRDIQQLLAANGILSHIHTTDRSSAGWRTIYRLNVTGAEFKARMSALIALSSKNRSIEGYRNHNNNYPRAVWPQLGVPGSYYKHVWDPTKPRISYRALSRVQERLSAAGQVALAARVDSLLHIIPDRIASIDPVGLDEVYDFEVDDVHMLSGNGFYTSNSRRGALMVMLDDTHPDALEFILAKQIGPDGVPVRIQHANMSLCVSDSFMAALEAGQPWSLSWNGEVKNTLPAAELWQTICERAHASAEPGVVFMERYQKQSNTWYTETINCVNPCFVGSTRVATDRGLLTAAELAQAAQPVVVLTDNRAADEAYAVVGGQSRHVRTGTVLRQATAMVKTRENVPVFRLMTEHGYSITATSDHKFLTPTGYVALQDLQAGDVLYLQSGEGCWSTDRLLPAIPWSERALARLRARSQRGEAQLPTQWTRELGQLLGWLSGDGWTYNHGSKPVVSLIFGLDDTAIMMSFRDMIRSWFGVEGSTARRHNTIRLDYDSVVATFVRTLGFAPTRATEKKVPHSLWQAPRDAVIGYLQGLFTSDGTVNVSCHGKSCTVRLASSSLELLTDVQLLLLNLGIVSRIHHRRDARLALLPNTQRELQEYETAVQYELLLDKENRDRFVAEIGFLSPTKQQKLMNYLQSKTRPSYKERWITAVASIEPVGAADVYDLTEPMTHSIVVNGIIAHQCGEQGLGPWGVCNLGHINLAEFVTADGHANLAEIARVTRVAVRFLDDVIDANYYFSIENRRAQQEGIRRIGLGTMGLADMLIKMGVRYGSPESLETIDEIYRTIRDAAYNASADLALEKGTFPRFDADRYLQGYFIQQLPAGLQTKIRAQGIRNGVLLSQAPTGTTSLLAGVSSGIEPVYDFAMRRRDRLGEHVIYHPLLQAWMDAHPGEETPDYFVGAKSLTPLDHVTVQAKVQHYTDASISKTTNAPNEHSASDVDLLYREAYKLGCKGVTYYRDGSRDAVLTSITEKSAEKSAIADSALVAADPAQEAAHLARIATLEAEVAALQVALERASNPRHRVEWLDGVTRNIATPEGKANVTINYDEAGPLEVFVNVGRAGSDITALAEALGRLISHELRIPSVMSPQNRLREMAQQLAGIGGSRSIGFGPNRVTSLPDAIARALLGYLDRPTQPGSGSGGPKDEAAFPSSGSESVAPVRAIHLNGGNGHSNGHGDAYTMVDYGATQTATLTAPRMSGNICPECGHSALVHEDGCKKCHSCGYSEC